MEVAAFVIGCVAFVLSLFNAGWQVHTWRHAHRFDVRVRIEQDYVEVGTGKFEITVVVENAGSTSEALRDISLIYPEHIKTWGGEKMRTGPPSVWDREVDGTELPPRREVRRAFDLLAGTFTLFPTEVIAYARVQSTQVPIESAPFKIDRRWGLLAAKPDPHAED